MYAEYFGLEKQPFTYTSDPHYLYFSQTHQTALDSLHYGIRNRVGFIAITGEIGSGKTTLCRHLLRTLPESVQTAYIFNTSLTEIQFLQTFMSDLGLDVAKKNRHALFTELNDFLISRLSQGKNVVLIIDEAQNLTLKLMEQIRMLSNLETDKEKLLQIILVGQPELADKLNHPSLVQLRQRIAIRSHVGALKESEIEHYVMHRLHLAAGSGDAVMPKFEPDALRMIYEYTKGVPRILNTVCDKCLLGAYASQTTQITGELAARAIQDTEGVFQ